MLSLRNLTKIYRTRGLHKLVLDRINLEITAQQSVALLGRNGAGKSTLMKIIAGTMDPTSGEVVYQGKVSWPVGFAGSFHPELTGAQNTRFVARIYDADPKALVEFVEDFAELGPHFRMPYRTYSSGMRSRLAFGVSMGIDFDIYLVDEVMSVGDASFREKSSAYFRERMRNSGAVVVSHSMPVIRDLCDVGVVLEGGHISFFDDIEQAIDQHTANMRGQRA